MRKRHLFILFVLGAAAMLLASCGTSGSADSSTSTKATVAKSTTPSVTQSTVNAPAPTDAAEETETTEATEPADSDTTEPGCNWDSGRIPSDGPSNVPASEGSDLSQAILGAWQHTHINEGDGWNPIKPTTDIRYVLSPDTFLYCQDVEGATDQAERSAALDLDGIEIILPSPATGYAVTAWDDNTMIWLNHRDDSLYLLQRR